MSISLTQVITNLQADIDAVDSDTSMDQILKYMHRARKLTGLASYYDSAGVLPSADSAYDGMLAFEADTNALYKFVDSSIDGGTIRAWHLADSNYSFSVTPYSGYVHGGRGVPPGSPTVNTSDIEKFNLTSETNGVSTGDLTDTLRIISSGRSSTHGYAVGGLEPTATPTRTTTIQKYPFAADGDATDVGDLSDGGGGAASNPSSSSTHSYAYGGYRATAAKRVNSIEKWSHATEGNTTDVGDLLVYLDYGESVHSADNGYTLGGLSYTNSGAPPTTQLNQISKFSFASDGDATDVGDLTTVTVQTNAFQSSTTGYKYSGSGGAPMGGDTIESFPFASDTNSADTSDNATTAVQFEGTGHNTDDAGFIAGGRDPSPGTPTQYVQTEIDKYLFAGGADMTNVADLSTGRSYHGGVNQN